MATLKLLPPSNAFRIQGTEQLLSKLYRMGLLPSTASLAEAEHIPASAFARRRLPIVLVRLKFCETVKEAVTFVEHGHVRVGPEVVTGALLFEASPGALSSSTSSLRF